MTAVLVLAGGRSRRMGADKPLLPFAGTTLLGRVLERLAGQGAPLLLSGGDDPERLASFGLPVLADAVPGGLGPLAGVLAGLERHGTLVSVPGDAPFLPLDLVARLEGAGAAMAVDADGRAHPVVALWPAAAAGTVRRVLEEGERRVGAALGRLDARRVRFDAGVPDPFLNLNTPADLRAAEALIRAAPPGPAR